MKKLLMLFLASSSFTGYSQSLDTLYTAKCQDITWTSQYRNVDRFSTIKFEDGSAIKVGDLIKIGRPSGTNTSRQQSTGLFSSTVSQMNNFSYLVLGRTGMAMMAGIIYVPENLKGLDAKLIEIKIAHTKLSKNSLANPILIFEVGGSSIISVWNYKLAFENGELINPNRPMNRAEAIAKLKEQKDLLDLGIITSDDFEISKQKLTKLITN